MMKYMAVYLMLKLAGNESPSAEEVTTALDAVGIETNADELTGFLKEIEGKDVDELVAFGSTKLSGGGGGGGDGGDAAEEKEEEKEEEEEEEIDMGGGMDMFGDGGGGDDY